MNYITTHLLTCHSGQTTYIDTRLHTRLSCQADYNNTRLQRRHTQTTHDITNTLINYTTTSWTLPYEQHYHSSRRRSHERYDTTPNFYMKHTPLMALLYPGIGVLQLIPPFTQKSFAHGPEGYWSAQDSSWRSGWDTIDIGSDLICTLWFCSTTQKPAGKGHVYV